MTQHATPGRTQVRRTLIRIAKARCRPGSGSAPDFLLTRTTSMRFPDLSGALGDLPHAVIGAAAARAYMPERMTSDLELAIALADARSARERLRAAGLTYLGELAIGGSGWRTSAGFPVDVVELSALWADDALAEAGRNRDINGQPVLPLPYLVLMKLDAGRAQDIADISRMLGQADDCALAAVRHAVSDYHPDAAEDVESLITLGKLEIERPA
ncbi:MAG: hypothetical protein NT029_06645 [Armatimonadetes bacterium]|nr:hypothetical protein [Armatimonadota bacterium]